MKNLKIRNGVKCILGIVFIAAVALLPQLVMAQIGGGGGGEGTGNPDAPIDGGLSLLVAAGVGYGIKKTRDARKKRMEPKNLVAPGIQNI